MPNIQDAAVILAHTLEQTVDAVAMLGADRKVLLFNAAAERLWGLERAEVIGHSLDVLLAQGLVTPSCEAVETAAAESLDALVGKPLEVPIHRPDGNTAWGAMSISRVELPERTLYTAFVKDITEQRRLNETLRLLSLGLNETDSAVVITDADHRIVHVNSGFTRMFGWQPQEVIGRQPRDLLFSSAHCPRTHFGDVHAQLATGRSYRSDELVCDSQERPLWCSVVLNPIVDAGGRLSNTVGIYTDITHTKMHEVLQHKVLAALVQEEPLPEVMTLICREVERIAPEVVATILQVDNEGKLRPLAAPRMPESYSRALDGVEIGPSVGSCGTAAFRGEPVLADIATDPLWAPYKHLALPLGLVSCWSSPIKRSDGRVVGTFAFYYHDRRGPTPLHKRLVEVSVHLCAIALEREEARARIRQLAFYDGLTGLPNRSLLQVQAEQAITRANREQESLAVLFIDLDRFKQVNDSLGHPAGDDLLRTVTARLRATVRDSDIVGRLSGDEFVVVLTQCDASRATDITEQLQRAIAAPCHLGDIALTPSASIGISLFPQNGRDMDTLLHRADMAMYQAKTSGRGRFSFFSNEMNLLAQERLALEAALREALRKEQLHLHYQPQIDLKDGHLYGVEALARWTHPEIGNIPPIRFIPLAEECGLIGELSDWALREACRQLADWRKRGLAVPAVSVNLSATNFHNLELPQLIADTLSTHALAASDLTVEITESLLMDTNPSTMKTLGDIHAQGVRLAMDDFGTGYSSLGYLRRLPVSELKLDKSFVRDLARDEATRALTNAVIRIGDSLRLTVVAEGVEDSTQQELLKAQGYHVAQGYLFSPPLPAAELERWLREHAL
ncbi:EAL domain-containing protein [Azoarcus indigens]|uniref:Diguanylate cyclase/phosphodiesterase with PAS/PAC sensor(S) n=1 Tax=Azoarcus indigens TaxID=29545 RepID=A0A4R6DSS7_9RHOO|nr:EAL domain-containing protein [Azoarcus indigens]NMG67992.1 EAL domain-containing protein [Azoarcus indigens]TDN48156.1 diguanylate cyclase/phosphodiesterase with PAS/PAC sensor(s) [Azoarcus indigens]